MIVATAPLQPRSRNQVIVPYAYAGLLVVMVALQLVTFEEFANTISTYAIVPFEWVSAVAVAVTATEIIALPFLLRLRLSALARAISALAGLLVPLWWLWLSLLVQIKGFYVPNTGLGGGLVEVESSWWIVVDMTALVLLGIWSFIVLRGPEVLRLPRR